MLCVLGLVLYIDRVCISVALPAMQKELAIEPHLLGWISLAFSISYAACEIPSGHLGDRFGPRGVLTRIVVWWSLFTALTGAAFGFTSLLVTRFLFGAGEAGAFPNASTVIATWFPAQSRARAMGVFGAATTIGGGLSPLLVIPIQQAYGWRASFFVFAACGLAWGGAWWLWFRDAPTEMNVSHEELAEIGEVRAQASHGLRWSVALRQRSIWGLVWMDFTDIYCAFFMVFWMPTYLAKARGFTDADLKWTALAWVGGMVGNLAGGAISDASVLRLGRAAGRRVVGVAAMLVVAALLVVAARSDDKAITLGALTGCNLMWGIIQANSFATCIDIGGLHVGTVAGVMNTAGQLGGALSALAFGYLVSLTGSYDIPVLVMAAASTLGAAGWIWIDAGKPLVQDG